MRTISLSIIITLLFPPCVSPLFFLCSLSSFCWCFVFFGFLHHHSLVDAAVRANVSLTVMETSTVYPPSATTWRRHIDRRRKELLARQIQLEKGINECLQLEASLTQLEEENTSALLKLREREVAVQQRRSSLEDRRTQREVARSQMQQDEEELKNQLYLDERKLDNAREWLEKETREAADQHAAALEALAAQQQQLQHDEEDALERVRRLADVELEFAARARRVQTSRDLAQKALNDTIEQLQRETQQLEKLMSPD